MRKFTFADSDLRHFLGSQNDVQEICYRGMLIYLIKDRQQETLELNTVVFSEKEFIPLIIKDAIQQLKTNTNKTFELSIDEKKICIKLIQKTSINTAISLDKAIRLFIFSARSWALTLKKMADKDLQAF